MAILLTGDIHGGHDIRKLSTRELDPARFTRDDYVIILGDFGLVWRDPPTGEERYRLDWLEAKPWTTLFVDGNHENHEMLAAMPVEEWHGGKIHRVRDHVLHLMRGEVFELDGRSFFSMGGAHSRDKELRTPYKTWWPGEVPSQAEREHALASLDRVGWQVDYVVTHCPPKRALYYLVEPYNHFLVDADEYYEWLQQIADKLEFKRWFFGHEHTDRPWAEPFTPLYNTVFDLELDGESPTSAFGEVER